MASTAQTSPNRRVRVWVAIARVSGGGPGGWGAVVRPRLSMWDVRPRRVRLCRRPAFRRGSDRSLLARFRPPLEQLQPTQHQRIPDVPGPAEFLRGFAPVEADPAGGVRPRR